MLSVTVGYNQEKYTTFDKYLDQLPGGGRGRYLGFGVRDSEVWSERLLSWCRDVAVSIRVKRFNT